MAVTCGFFNALEHDRLYDAIQMSSIFDGIIRDGIFSTIGTSMAVTASGTGLVVNVGAGRAWFNHTWILNDTLYPVEAEAAEVVLDRIDALVIEVNQSAEVRDCSIKFVKGTPSSRPTRPTMTHNAEVNQYALAYVSIRAGQTTIFQADITSVIGNDETPFVTGLLQQTSIESIVAQWQDEFYTYFNNFRSTTTSDFNTWMVARVAEYNAWYASMEAEGQADLAEFDSWFQEMKDQLSEDAAGHLQAEIDALELSAEKGSVVIVTTSDDTLINHACTISQGSSERNATFDINRVATFESIPFVGNMHITATNGTLIASKDINIPYFGRYNYDLEFWEATLAISSSSTELYERPITITKGGTTVGTTSFDNTGHATFKVHEPGTYTVTSTTTGGAVFTANVEVTAETSYPVDLGTPIGRTALPTDDIQLWLKCGGEYNVTYTTLAEVLADTELFARLCADSNACDYMARSTTWALNSGEVPTLSSDTGSNGQCVKSTAQNNFPAYYAFDSNDSTKWRSSSGANEYIGYHFDAPVVINKVTFKSEQDSFIRLKNYEIRGSNDNFATYETLASGTYANNVHVEEVDLNNTDAYSDYCLYCIDHYSTTAYGFSMVSLQFYQADITTNATAMQIVGKYDYCANALLGNSTWCEALAESSYYEYVFDGCVPKMTSNTAPSGEVTGTTPRDTTTYALWKAFDRDTSTIYSGNVNTAANNTGGGFIQYHHTEPVCIKGIKLQSHTSNVYPYKSVKVEVSNDGSTYDTIFDDSVDFVTGFVDTSDNIKTGTYTKVTVTQLNDTGSSTYFPRIIDCQFYGRTKTVDYTPLVPVMTDNTHPSGECICSGISPGYPAYQAFDGNDSTMFISNNGSSEEKWIGYDFGAPVLVKKVDIHFGNVSYTDGVKVQGYDGSSWVDIKTVSPITEYTTIILDENIVSYSKYRVLKTDGHNDYSIAAYTLQFYAESDGIVIHSAANDTIYYLDGSTPVTVAVTDANGRATIDRDDLDPGTYTLYSTVAKNPSNLSNPYTKSINITQYTTEIYLMPSDKYICYWFGFVDNRPCCVIEDCTSANGWSQSNWYLGTPTHNTNKIRLSASAGYYTAISTKNTVNTSKVKIIATGVSPDETGSAYGGCIRPSNKTNAFSSWNDWVGFTYNGMHYYEKDTTYNNLWITCYIYTSGSVDINALWYE